MDLLVGHRTRVVPLDDTPDPCFQTEDRGTPDPGLGLGCPELREHCRPAEVSVLEGVDEVDLDHCIGRLTGLHDADAHEFSVGTPVLLAVEAEHPMARICRHQVAKRLGSGVGGHDGSAVDRLLGRNDRPGRHRMRECMECATYYAGCTDQLDSAAFVVFAGIGLSICLIIIGMMHAHRLARWASLFAAISGITIAALGPRICRDAVFLNFGY
jgi:hypothetical protein